MKKRTENITELLDRFYAGESRPEERERLEVFFSKEENADFDVYSRLKWQQSASQMDARTAARIREDLMAKIGADRPVAGMKSPFKQWIRTAAKISAAASVLIATAACTYWFAMANLQSQTFEVATLKGQKSLITLPDGSTVRLNSSSKLIYSSAFNRRDRKIEMEGEAYFEVAKNPELPFTVTAGGMDVTALGTKFDIRAYAEDHEMVTTLVEGKVSVEMGGKEKIITPNQQVCYSKQARSLYVQQVLNEAHSIPWINDELMFDGETLRQIAVELERMYNVSITFVDKGIMNLRYTGLVLNTSLTNVLDLITSTSPVKYSMNGSTIEFSRKKTLNL